MRHRSTIAPTFLALGLSLAGWTAAGIAAEPLDDRLGIRTAPIMLVLRSDVQADLQLDAQQVALCRRAAQALYQRAVTIKGRVGTGADAARREINEHQTDTLRRTLNSEQLDRLKKIDLQWEGASAMLSRPLLDDSLNLTQEQKEAVEKLVADARSRRASRPPTYDEHLALTRAAIALLNERQKELWIHVLGRHCQFSVGNPAMVPAPNTPAAAAASARPAVSR
jgi:hypothetical protein